MARRKIEPPIIPVEVYENPNRKAFIYVVASGAYLKIGITLNLKRRLKDIECHNPHEVRLVKYRRVPAHYARRAEMQIHAELAPHRHRGEWFVADLDTVMQVVKRAVYDAERWNSLAVRQVNLERLTEEARVRRIMREVEEEAMGHPVSESFPVGRS